MDLNKFFAILQLMPVIIAIVKSVEAAIPIKGQGQQKLNLVLNTVAMAADKAPAIQQALPKDDLNATVTSIVNATVAVLNETGVFQK